MARLNKKAGFKEVLDEIWDNQQTPIGEDKVLLLLELSTVLDKLEAGAKQDQKFNEILEKLELFPYGLSDLINKLDDLVGHMDFFR